MTCRGYAQPRLEALTGRPRLALLITALGNALQHVAMPLALDWQSFLIRFLGLLPGAMLMGLIYLK